MTARLLTTFQPGTAIHFTQEGRGRMFEPGASVPSFTIQIHEACNNTVVLSVEYPAEYEPQTWVSKQIKTRVRT